MIPAERHFSLLALCVCLARSYDNIWFALGGYCIHTHTDMQSYFIWSIDSNYLLAETLQNSTHSVHIHLCAMKVAYRDRGTETLKTASISPANQIM